MIAIWRYEDVPNTVWKIEKITDFWGINTRTQKRLYNKGILTIKHLAEYDFFKMREFEGLIGEQLIAHAWGVDRTKLSDVYVPKSKSIGNSQVLMKDYTNEQEIKIVLREIVEQVASRIRSRNTKTACVKVGIGYSKAEEEKGFQRQLAIPATNQSKALVHYCFSIFEKYYKKGLAVRHISVSFTKLEQDSSLQLNLFEEPKETIENKRLDETIDIIRRRYGFASIVHASSYMDGATSLKRASLVGGHAGGSAKCS